MRWLVDALSWALVASMIAQTLATSTQPQNEVADE